MKKILLMLFLFFAPFSIAHALTTTTTSAGDWSTAGIWDNGVPGVDDTAVVNHAVAITSNITFNVLDNNSTITFDATARTVTIKDGGSIDNSGGTITDDVNDGDVTYKASAGVSNWSWQINSGTWTKGSGVHHFEYGNLYTSATVAFNQGTYNFDQNMYFYSTANAQYFSFNDGTTVNFAANKTYTLGNDTNTMQLAFSGIVNAIGGAGTEITFSGKSNETYIWLEGTNSLDADFEYCIFNTGLYGMYLNSFASASGDQAVIDNCDFTNSSSHGMYITSMTGTLTLNGNDFFSNTGHGAYHITGTGTINFVGGSGYSNTGNAYRSDLGVMTLNKVTTYANSNWCIYIKNTVDHTNLEVVNCLSRDELAGMNFSRTTAGKIMNCTIADTNTSYASLTINLLAGDVLPITNTIISGGKYGVDSVGAVDPEVTYSDVRGAATANYNGMTDPSGTNGNISQNPNFTNSAGDDYTLDTDPLSPCINLGTNTGAPVIDIVSATRPMPALTNTDMGAYEEQTTTNLRYFINGGVDNNWNTIGNWSTTSGGAGGASVPSSGHKVYFDASSPNCTVNVAANASTIDCTGYTGTLTQGANLTVASDLKLVAGMTFTPSTYSITKTAYGTITPSGKIFYDLSVTINKTILAGALDFHSLSLSASTELDAAGYQMNVGGNWNNLGTFTPNGNTVIFDQASGTATIDGNSTFYNFTCATSNLILEFDNTKTQTITNNFTLTGTSGNNVVLISDIPGTRWELIRSGGADTITYTSATDSDASGGTIVNATGGTNTDGGNNLNWRFKGGQVISVD